MGPFGCVTEIGLFMPCDLKASLLGSPKPVSPNLSYTMVHVEKQKMSSARWGTHR